MLISDWSSDVCSSDLFPRSSNKALQALPLVESGAADACNLSQAELAMACASHGGETRHTGTVEIGRASCRERVCQYVSISVVAVSLKKNKQTHVLESQTS